MVDVLIATHAGASYGDQDDQVLADALRRIGIECEVRAWTDPEVDWASSAMVVIRTTWDYFDRRDEFVAWARAVESVTRLENSADVIDWNTHKGYLATLEERGAPIVPTVFLARGDRADLAALLEARGWSDAIIKPAIGGGAMGLRRVGARGDDPAGDQQAFEDLLRDDDVLLQPFVDSVLDGELSLVFFDGVCSHAVRKVPRADEIRVQVEFGGAYARVEPPDDAVALAGWILEATGHRFQYARVDLLADEDGSWMLAELEVTEPSLYLHTVPEGADRLAAVIARQLAD